ncbi:hypothetical protein [Methylobacterium soli]|uniref:hypothetical protein n=1 Tax=Methylobacterium soli TaxID=553447 RepID=UPI001247ED49|nr:hypothetical protein [Methylobacterium soli]
MPKRVDRCAQAPRPSIARRSPEQFEADVGAKHQATMHKIPTMMFNQRFRIQADNSANLVVARTVRS